MPPAQTRRALKTRRDGPHRLSLRHAGQQHAGRFEKITAFAVSLRDAYGLATDGRVQTLGPRSPWASASSPFSAESVFSAAALFDISASTNSPFGSHQGIRSAVADCSDP